MTRTVRDIVQVVPDSIKAALAALVALVVMLAAGSAFSAARARRLDHQRGELREEVGLLQAALLPPVPTTLGALRTSVAYRPADGPGAGGDFYDAFPLADGRAGLILGDLSGHGRAALAHTAFMRYTLRAYLEAGLAPRKALQVAGRVVGEQLGDDFATVLVAVHDAAAGSLIYAGAGHPPPLLAGSSSYEPVTAASSPPIGVGSRTGQRQTSLPLAPGTVACLYTDGLVEAKTRDGILGRDRLGRILAQLGPDGEARELLDRVAREAREVPDDMAACLVSPEGGLTSGGFRLEELELDRADLKHPIAPRFLAACGVPADAVAQALAEARESAERSGGAVLTVTYGNRGRRVDVLPRNVESLEVASRPAVAR